MEIRELVRLKRGTGGLEPPENIGIILSREKGGKDHVARVFTLKGEMTVKWRTIREASGEIFKGDKKNINSMKESIKRAIEVEKKDIGLKMEPGQILDSLSSMDLWNSVISEYENGDAVPSSETGEAPFWCEGALFSSEDIARIHFHPHTLAPDQLGAVKKILSGSNDIWEPYFHKIDRDRKTSYFPYKRKIIEMAKDHISKFESMRNRFIEIREEEDEDGRRRRNPIPLFNDPKDAVLDETDGLELGRICSWAKAFMQNGDWNTKGEDIFGLAGTPIRKLGSFDLEKFISMFSHYIIGSKRWDLPSDLTGMLLRLDRISKREASELVVKYDLGSGRSQFHGIFPDHVLKAAKRFPDHVSNEDLSGRKDLRDLETYTIDPSDAKDFDDAVSILRDGNDWIIWIHIADVSHYVRPGDLIDDEARYRGTSVYLPTGVLPMLPRELSEHLCSLMEKKRRLVVTTKIKLSGDFEIVSHEHFRSVIEVDRNLSYEQVDQWIEEGKEPFTFLHEISNGLSNRYKRLSLDTPERRIRFSGENDINISIKRPTSATKAIEQLMVLTNESAARTLRDYGYPLPYRVHPLPDRTSVERFNNICRSLGLETSIEVFRTENRSVDMDPDTGNEDSMVQALLSGGKIEFGGIGTSNISKEPKESGEEVERKAYVPIEDIEKTVNSYNSFLDTIDEQMEPPLNEMARIWMLRTMPRAFYSEENIGHFGLGSDCYCHFTSPIRRYPDILVHRSIANVIEKEQGDCGFVSDPPEEEEMIDLLEHVNDMSDEAEKWERTMIDVALSTRAFTDPQFRNGSHPGIVTSIVPSSLFVQFMDGVTEGRVPIRVLSDLRLDVDEFGTRVIMSLDSNSDIGTDDPLIVRALSEGVDEIDVIRLGERKKFSIFNISLADGRIELSLSETL